jgi:hypothetical protein
MNQLRCGAIACVVAVLSTLPSRGRSMQFDIAPFALRCCVTDQHTSQVEFDYAEAEHAPKGAERTADGHYVYGLQWAEARDVKEVRVYSQAGNPQEKGILEYWFGVWPYPPPRMPSIEDPLDDPWQGQWLKAHTSVNCSGDECRYTFAPLTLEENPRADNLPGLAYRRTIKLRLVYPRDPHIEKLSAFTGSQPVPIQVRIELGAGENMPRLWRGDIRAYNGWVRTIKLWNPSADDTVSGRRFRIAASGSPKGIILSLVATKPSLPGSNDVTVVTVDAGDRTFSFATSDLQNGPIYIRPFHIYVSAASDPKNFSPSIVRRGAEIREKLAGAREQTYERASREIPALDPIDRENNRPLYLPLAADSSWQKFAFEWGGNVFISKKGTKAMGDARKRLEWKGDEIHWRLATGDPPAFNRGWHDSELSTLRGYLPLAVASWSSGGIDYNEEAFATLLSGPLSPQNPARSEETPAVLMLKLTAKNIGAEAATSNIWLAIEPGEQLKFEHGELVTQNGGLVRAAVHLPIAARSAVGIVKDGSESPQALHIQFPLGAGAERSIVICLPFVPRLTRVQNDRLLKLNYVTEGNRVAGYWDQMTTHAVPFEVPEKVFNSFARAVISHILISVTKDPKSGLYIDPAASYVYDVFENEAVYQGAMLDAMGLHGLAAEFLKTFVRLQGSKPIPGAFSGDQSAVYHGAQVDPQHDYTMSPYDLDPGAVLWGLAEHYFFTRDRHWLSANLLSMTHEAQWLVSQRRLTEVLDRGKRVPEYGLLPAGDLEDNRDWGHWFAVNAFAAAGMTRLAQALEDIGSPEAGRYADEAASYVKDLRAAMLRASRKAGVVHLRDNTYVPWVPPRPYQRVPYFGRIRVAYYTRYPQKVVPLYRLSTDREVLSGPMVPLVLNIFQAKEPIADWMLNVWEDDQTLSEAWGINVHGWAADRYWFSRGGMVFQANLINPILAYLRRDEIPAAIRNLYNDFAACYYPGADAFTEEYHEWIHASGPFYKISDEAQFVHRVRDLLVLEKGDALWLLEGIPRRWLAPGKQIELTEAPTYFGPVSCRVRSGDSSVTAEVKLPSRNPYRAAYLVLRFPGNKRIQSVQVDGQPWHDFEAASQQILLPRKTKPMRIVVHF